MSAHRKALTALFIDHVFRVGSYRHDEFAEVCAEYVADAIGGNAWHLDGTAAVLDDVAARVELEPLLALIRDGSVSVGSLAEVCANFVRDALTRAGLVRAWARAGVTPC